jgi:hypothetical protein
MRLRPTTLALGVVAVAMALFIVLFERGTLSTSELQARGNRVVRSFVRPRVTDVEIERGQVRIAIHREREEDLDAFEIGHWVLTHPIRTDADQDAVDSLLSALEWLEARRTLEGISEQDRRTFGLREPRAVVRFVAADRHVTVSVGADDPRGEGVYVGVSDDPDRAWVVGRDFLEALSHDADHFRRKELFAQFRSVDVSAIELRNAALQARLEREGGRWWVREPSPVLARAAAVEDLFELAREIAATRFLSETLRDAAAFGLDTPSRELVIHREGTDARTDGGRASQPDRTPLRLRIGGVCPDHPDERVALAGEGPVVCVRASAIEPLDADLARLRESRLVAMRDDELERAEIRAGGVRFELRPEEGGEGFRLIQGEREVAADRGAITEWMRELRAQEALRYEPATSETLAARGLATPRAVVELHRADAERTETIYVGAHDPDGVWIRRGEDPQLALFPPAAAALVPPSAIRFRRRQLIRETEGSARRLRVARGDEEELLERDGDAWAITAPYELPADRVIARDVVRSMANLTALRFVAERAAPEHGLERPRIELTAVFDPGPSPESAGHEHANAPSGPRAGSSEGGAREFVLRIGAPTEGGAFARLGDDPAVFVVPADLVEDLEGPLVSRDLLATETADLESLVLVRGGERIELRREGEGWTAGQGPADPARTTLILDRLASLRALGTTSWGPAPRERGLASPTLALEVVRRTGTPRSYRIEVGALGAPGAEGWYHARRADLQVGFRLGAGVVRDFLDYQP